MFKANFQISISGGIAVGKTTLAKMLDEKLQNCLTIIEIPEKNPYLSDFYSDMKRWSFHSRIGMLSLFAERYKKMQAAYHQSEIVVMDRCINELITFAIIQHSKGNLSTHEFNTFKEILDAFVLLSPSLDIVIHLSCSPNIALERIKSRGRKFESDVQAEYLLEIDHHYNDWVSSLPSSIHVIACNTNNGIDFETLIKSISNKFNERKAS
jgi:deoxyadenosine/deoxycytidine kinase